MDATAQASADTLVQGPAWSAGFPGPGDKCDGCGYPLRGLVLSADCPECGRAVARSNPAARRGWAWQRRPSPGSFFATAWSLVTGPRRAAETVRVEGSLGPAMLFAVVSLTGVWAAASVAGWSAVAVVDRAMGAGGSAEWLAPAVAGVVMAHLGAAMALIEAGGLTFLGGRRGWTLRFAGNLRLCAYATIGWLPGAVVMSSAVLGAWAWYDAATPAQYQAVVGRLPAWLNLPAVVAVAGLILLMVCSLGFEVIAARLAQACRFARRGRVDQSEGSGPGGGGLERFESGSPDA
ncbi:MAG: hypothetical protein AAGA57_11965 [Planctomycetota bacterium]